MEGVLCVKNRLYTLNMNPGRKVYGERLTSWEGVEYREWDPFRSKLAAAILKRMDNIPIKRNTHVLYLGAAQGTTVSHISDIAREGAIYCVEIATKPFEKLLKLCEERANLIPILGDAMQPDRYADTIEKVDFIYQDVSQRNQAEIFVKNAKRFLKRGKCGFIVIKARSISIANDAKNIFESEIKSLRAGGLKIKEIVDLRPFDRDHIAVLVQVPKEER